MNPLLKMALYTTALLTLAACHQQTTPTTLTLPQALNTIQTADSMYRELYYLGTAKGYHYFETSRGLAPNHRFRIPATEYTPKQQTPYRAWFPQRTAVAADWANMMLKITTHHNSYRYSIGRQQYQQPADIPPHLWAGIRLVQLPSKLKQECARATAAIAPYTKNNPHITYMGPTGGLPAYMLPHNPPRSGNGTINATALDALMRPTPAPKP